MVINFQQHTNSILAAVSLFTLAVRPSRSLPEAPRENGKSSILENGEWNEENPLASRIISHMMDHNFC